MSDFPRMIYQVGNQEEMHGGRYDYMIVEDQDALDMLLANGWYMTTGEAKIAAAPKTADVPFEDRVLTRDKIEAKAYELGLKFDGRTRDSKLLAMIDVELEKQEKK